jgi:hypothetical protein
VDGPLLDYELSVEFTRHEGDGGIGVIFPVGIHNCFLDLGTAGGTMSGVSFIDGKSSAENPTRRQSSPVSNNERHQLTVRVQTDGTLAAFSVDWDQAMDYIKWEGPARLLANTDPLSFKLPTTRHLWLTSESGRVTFQTVRIRVLSGGIRRDVITNADREQDLKNGFVRLVGEKGTSVSVGWAQFLVNQLPLELAAGAVERRWPLITRDFKVCEDFYSAHAPSRIKIPIPKTAKSFSGIGYNDAGRASKYLVLIDGKQVYDSGLTAIVVVKVDIPARASVLELVTERTEVDGPETTYWCFPRFHATVSERVKDRMLDAEPGPLQVKVASGTAGYGEVAHNKPIPWVQSIPIHFRDALPCDEFLLAHATSTVSYRVADGMTRFTAIAYNVISHSVNYEVWADAKRIYESPRVGIIPIDVKLPTGTKLIELKINDLDGNGQDFSFWCYPRLHRK